MTTTQVIASVQLIKVDVAGNHNKFWFAQLLNTGAIEVHNGRVGSKGQKRIINGSVGRAGFDRCVREKLAKGYTPVQTLDSASAVSAAVDVKQVALSQIETDSKTQQLIEYLSEVNIHNILAGTTLTYAGNGTFSTPLGPVTSAAIAQARQLLNRLAQQPLDRIPLLNQYLMLIPQKLGQHLTPDLFTTTSELQQQQHLLDSLEAVLPTTSTVDRVFDCSVQLVPHTTEAGRHTFRSIKQRFESSINSAHLSAQSKLKHVYSVEIPSMTGAFESSLEPVQALWHGTRSSNLLSILKQGLVIPPSGEAHCTGRMFGNGVYFTTQSTKALNYATNYWNRSGSQGQRLFMFLADVALGKIYRPSVRTTTLPAGYDSMWVEAGTCHVINPEAIVYRPSQVRLRYLCEFASSENR